MKAATRAAAPPPPDQRQGARLVAAARAVRRRAYAPYSGFRVGAAVLDERGRVHVGCNLENASYGLTVCAERNAVAAAVAAGARRLRAIAIASGARPPAPPCGACRQVLVERAPAGAVVWLAGPAGAARAHRLGDLLPGAFTLRRPAVTSSPRRGRRPRA